MGWIIADHPAESSRKTNLMVIGQRISPADIRNIDRMRLKLVHRIGSGGTINPFRPRFLIVSYPEDHAGFDDVAKNLARPGSDPATANRHRTYETSLARAASSMVGNRFNPAPKRGTHAIRARV